MKARAISPNVVPFARRRGWLSVTWYAIQTRLLNKFRRRKNTVTMKALTRGQWYDCDTRLFEAGFQILVDYVEGELAWMELINQRKARWHHRWFGIRNARELGLRMLEWEIQLGEDSTTQSEAATEIRDLYLWYKDVRPARLDTWRDVPDRPFVVEERDDGSKYLPSFHEDEEYVAGIHLAAEREEADEQEDTDQLIRIMKIRRSMWT